MSYKFVEAANYSVGGNLPVYRIVIHDEEYPEKPTSAEEVALFFARQAHGPSGSSAHLVVDSDSVVQCVHFEDRAWHAPPNSHSVGLEHSGYAHQTPEQWLDDYGVAMLKTQSAPAVAQLCRQFDIPVRKLSAADLIADPSAKGICGHGDVSAAFHQSTHVDPGPSFPWGQYLTWVSEAMHPAPTPTPISQEEEMRPYIVKIPTDPTAYLVTGFQDSSGKIIVAQMTDGNDLKNPPDGYGPVIEITEASFSSKFAK